MTAALQLQGRHFSKLHDQAEAESVLVVYMQADSTGRGGIVWQARIAVSHSNLIGMRGEVSCLMVMMTQWCLDSPRML